MVTGSNFMTALEATSYFEKDNYYLQDGMTEKGRWSGETAKHFGLSGDINMKDFYAIANGIRPEAFTENDYKFLRQLDREAANLKKEFEGLSSLAAVKKPVAEIKYKMKLEAHNQLRKEFNQRLGTENKLVFDTKAKEEEGGLYMHHRAGYDLTFSAPKSATIMALIGGDKRLIDAHSEAVARVMRYLEKHFSQARVGTGDARSKETTQNLLAAQFTHYTSRSADGAAPDPQLHTHNFIFNISKTSDGYKSIDNKEMLRAIKLAGQLYHNEYGKLVQELGYATECHKTGSNLTVEIKGVNREIIDFYSKRHNQLESLIKAKETELGRNMTNAERVAFKRDLVTKTRSAKEPQDLAKLEDAWQMELDKNFLLSKNDLHNLTQNQVSDKAINGEMCEAIQQSVQTADESKSVFTQHDLLFEMAKMSLGTNSMDSMSEIIFSHVKGQLAEPTDIFKLGSERHNSQTVLFSSKAIIDAEARIFQKLENGKNKGLSFDQNVFEDLYGRTKDKFKHISEIEKKDFFGLTHGQEEAFRHIMTNQDRIIGIQGDAGTGKTTMLKYLNEAIGQDVELIGVSTTAKAAKEIELSSGIRSMTIDRFLRGKDDRSERPRMLVIDESSMVGTKKIDALLEKVDAQTKIVFLGDNKQLKAIEAGDIFKKLMDHGMPTVAMTESIRQKTDVTKDVAALFKDVESVGAALDALHAKDRLIDGEEYANQFVENVTSDYRKHGMSNVLALVSTNSERKEYNGRIRSILQHSGALGQDNVNLSVYQSKHLSGADIKFAGNYEASDRLLSTKMQGDLKSGQYAEIKNVDKNTNSVEILYSTRKGEKTKWIDANKLDNFNAFRVETRDFSVGDKISFEKNEKHHFGFDNGQTATVKKVDANGNLSIETLDGRSVDFNISEFKHIDHAYTMTTHKSQGQSVAHAHILANSTSGINIYNAGYVQMTRAIEDIHLYTDDRQQLEKKYGIVHTPDNAIDHLGKEGIAKVSEIDKLIKEVRNAADKKHIELSASASTEQRYDRQKNRSQIRSNVRKTREVQLYEMDKRLAEYGRIDLNKSYAHAIANGYASTHYVQTLHRMKKRLGQLEKKGFVTELKDNIYVFNRAKEGEFHKYQSSFIAAVDRADAASSSWTEDFKKVYKKLNSKKAFIGRRYGRPGIQREINAGIDRAMNEAFAGSVALVTATTKFVAKTILKLGVKVVHNVMERRQHHHDRNKNSEFSKKIHSTLNSHDDRQKQNSGQLQKNAINGIREEYRHRR